MDQWPTPPPLKTKPSTLFEADCSIPQSVTQLKAFLGSTQQMAQYVPYYALIAAPLHKLTRKGEIFPTGPKWIPGSDYDLAYHHVKSLMLDRLL
jgi:hypothetical protein